ncbi:retinoic acid receptor responder protein 2 isoform X4 [Camelus ferus]|uniref:Retinoic acid receptor responder protein 2 n=2 Tax=Camelus TaxID=9836 RepID=A0A8B8TA08_CAMFR|nr:retinoic acid receptor responder protein 2 isoform X4 [Camelus ferus]XP_045372501.1 retinoic acid receptor responder protein 2 isoform X4 [Camelus bactrianus]
MWQLLLPLALWLGAMGLGRAELTEAQHRGLQVALEEFHKHPPVQWAFQKTSMDSAMDMPLSAGTFVRLEFKLQQTSCRKKDWKNAECKVKPNGQGSKEHQEAQCSRVQRAGEDLQSYYLPGQFAFLKALPPS